MIDFEFDDGVLTKAEIRDQHNIFVNSKVNNQYYVRINRVAPSYSLEKSITISKMIKRVSVIHDAMDVEEVILGSAYLNLLLNKQSGEISISFIEDKDASVMDFLLKSGGEDIYPTDGSYLLPYEYYFNIEIEHYKSSKKNTLLLNGDFILSGNVPHEYQAEEEEHQRVDATFKSIKSWK